MKKTFTILIVVMVYSIFAFEPKFMKDPAISPDGKTICFAYASDLWTVPYEGGIATRITSAEGVEYSPIFSNDGKFIYYNSNRGDGTAIYKIPTEGGISKKICQEGISVIDIFNDDKYLLGQGSIAGGKTGYFKIPITGERPIQILEIGEFFGSLSPDNKEIIFTVRGIANREKYQGSTNGELYKYNFETQEFTRLTKTKITERYPRYSYQKNGFYFGRSDGNNFQLFFAPNGDISQSKQLTNFSEWSLRDIDVSHNTDRIVYEKFSEIWRYDDENKASKVNIDIKEDMWKKYYSDANVKNKYDLFAVSENGKLIAFSYKYDLFLMPEKGGEVKQITFDQNYITSVAILGNYDVYFVKYDKGESNLYHYNIIESTEPELIEWSKDKYIEWVEVSDSVLRISYDENQKITKLFNLQLNSDSPELLIAENNISSYKISPDGKFAVYTKWRNDKSKREIIIQDRKTGKSRSVYQTNYWISQFNWGKDNKSLFATIRGDIYKFNLIPIDSEEYFIDNWKDVINEKDENNEKTKDQNNDDKITPINIKFEDFEKRISKIVGRKGYNYIYYFENDSTFVYANENAKNTTLYKKIINNSDEKEIASLGKIDDLQYNEQTKTFYFKKGNSLNKISANGGKITNINNNFRYFYDLKVLNQNIFNQVWTEFGRGFYDENMHNVDWKKLKRKYSPFLQYSDNVSVLNDIIDEMIGDVDASHTGFYPREENDIEFDSFAYLGMIFDFKERLNKGIKIRNVFSRSKENLVYGLKSGDVILEINDHQILENTEIRPLLRNQIGKKLKMKIKTTEGEKNITLVGLPWNKFSDLRYFDKIDRNKELVTQLSKGKLGYLHIRRMNKESLEQFYTDFYAVNSEKEGLIIDIRGNGGGNIHQDLIDAINKTPNATIKRRNYLEEAIRPYNTIQLPMILLIDEDSFSDAEIFPHLFKYLKMGKIVGTPTSGSVIGTLPFTLMDGSSMRMPMSGWYLLNGMNLEGNGAQPDIKVENSLQDKVNDFDKQLRTAIKELLKEI